MFFVMGVVSMAWVPRIPEIKEANGLTDTQSDSRQLISLFETVHRSMDRAIHFHKLHKDKFGTSKECHEKASFSANRVSGGSGFGRPPRTGFNLQIEVDGNPVRWGGEGF
jgi:hypothetical protein